MANPFVRNPNAIHTAAKLRNLFFFCSSNLYKLINASVINKFKKASAVAANEIKKIPGRVKKLIRMSDLVIRVLFSLTKVAKL